MAILALLRVVTSQTVALDVVLRIGIGGVVGAGLLRAFGRRAVLPTQSAVLEALHRLGLDPVELEAAPGDPGGPVVFTAVLADGRPLHCKAITAGGYEADSIRRDYRRVRVRELGEDVAYSSVRRAAAVEGMLALSPGRCTHSRIPRGGQMRYARSWTSSRH